MTTDNMDDELIERFRRGESAALARVITLVEDGHPRGKALYRELYGAGRPAWRVGLTGPVGVGKSTLIGKLAARFRADGRTVGIVSVDPTSPFTQGALLGDRVRMGELAGDEGVFMRSMASRGSTGGLCRTARMTVDMMESFGRDVILIETVGVGQSEVDILDTVDTLAVALMPQAGDNIQVLKAGLMEVADVFVLNKADLAGAEDLGADLISLVGMDSDRRAASWTPLIVKTEASHGRGIDELAAGLAAHRDWLDASGLRDRKKQARVHKQIRELFQEDLLEHIMEAFDAGPHVAQAVDRVVRGQGNPLSETEALVNAMLKELE